MKKLFTTLMVAAAMMMAAPANAGIFQFGLRGGLNVTNMSTDLGVLDKSNQAGFYVGPTVKIDIPMLMGLSFDASALYDQRTTKVGDESLKSQNIFVPINIRYGISFLNLASAYLRTGPQVGFNVGDKNFNWKDTKSYAGTFKLKDSNFSWNFGIGVMVMNHLEVTANYNVAMGKTGDMTVSKALSEAGTEITGAALDAALEKVGLSKSKDTKTNAWQIGLAYYF